MCRNNKREKKECDANDQIILKLTITSEMNSTCLRCIFLNTFSLRIMYKYIRNILYS